MANSPLQDVLLENLTEIMRCSRTRVNEKIDFLKEEDQVKVDEIVWNEIKGIIHGVLCEFDGATSLADHGLISIVDENGQKFDRYLHELTFDKLKNSEL